MRVKQINTGHFIDKKEVISVELANDQGTLVSIFNYGTIIHKFIVENAKGKKQDIVLGFDTFEQYLSEDYLANYAYLGAIIGRYANRIKDGKFEVDGQEYQLAKTNGEDCLHGGLHGFDSKVWEIVALSESPHASVTFQYLSLDGEENFPGDLGVQITFELTNNNELILTYQADTDEPTPVNLTHHSYFNLSETGESIVNHIHQINASAYLEQDENSVVTGKLIPVEGTQHEFRKARKIGEGWDPMSGYDQTYVLDKEYGDLTLVSKTTETKSGLSLLVYSTEPVAHFYTAKYLNVKNGKAGQDYTAFDGFCIETQHHPNAINIPTFPNTILLPDEVYSQITIYKVTKN